MPHPVHCQGVRRGRAEPGDSAGQLLPQGMGSDAAPLEVSGGSEVDDEVEDRGSASLGEGGGEGEGVVGGGEEVRDGGSTEGI